MFSAHANNIAQNQSLLFPKSNHKLTGSIEEPRHIYDDDLPPNASPYQIDLVTVGSKVTCLIRDVKEHHTLTEISLTLLNSRLQGCKQIALDSTQD